MGVTCECLSVGCLPRAGQIVHAGLPLPPPLLAAAAWGVTGFVWLFARGWDLPLHSSLSPFDSGLPQTAPFLPGSLSLTQAPGPPSSPLWPARLPAPFPGPSFPPLFLSLSPLPAFSVFFSVTQEGELLAGSACLPAPSSLTACPGCLALGHQPQPWRLD